MVANHLISWMIGREDPQDARNRSHAIALREARLATELRAAATEPARAPRVIAFATASGSSVELACCPA